MTPASAVGVAMPSELLSVTPLEQIFRSCFEAFRTEHLESKCIGEPVGRFEREADCKRVLYLLARQAGGQRCSHVLSTQPSFRRQLTEHPQRCSECLPDGG